MASQSRNKLRNRFALVHETAPIQKNFSYWLSLFLFCREPDENKSKSEKPLLLMIFPLAPFVLKKIRVVIQRQRESFDPELMRSGRTCYLARIELADQWPSGNTCYARVNVPFMAEKPLGPNCADQEKKMTRGLFPFTECIVQNSS